MVSIPIDSYPFDDDDAPSMWVLGNLAVILLDETLNLCGHYRLSLRQHHLTSRAFICRHPYLLQEVVSGLPFINFNFLPIASRNFGLLTYLFRQEELAKFIISRTLACNHPSF